MMYVRMKSNGLGAGVERPRRAADETRRLQLTMAGVAVRHPDLTCDEQREAELEEVLYALGLLQDPNVKERRQPSGFQQRQARGAKIASEST